MQHAGGYRPRDGALPVEWIVAHHQPADLSAASLKIARAGAGLGVIGRKMLPVRH